MKRKIFININLAGQIRRRLAGSCAKWQAFPVKWTKEDNLHIELFFLGYVDNEVVLDICQKVAETVRDRAVFDLEFEKIILVPNVESPQEFRVAAKPSEELKNLCEAIEKKLEIFVVSKKVFSPHITLGKIRKEKWKELEKKPLVDEKASFAVSVDTVDIMASHFSERKNSFVLIESCPLK